MYVVTRPQDRQPSNPCSIPSTGNNFFLFTEVYRPAPRFTQHPIKLVPKLFKSPVSVVAIRARLRAGRYGVRIPLEARDCSLLQNVQTGSGAHSASIQWVVRKLGGRNVELTTHLHVVPGLKNQWSYISTLPLFTNFT